MTDIRIREIEMASFTPLVFSTSGGMSGFFYSEALINKINTSTTMCLIMYSNRIVNSHKVIDSNSTGELSAQNANLYHGLVIIN